MQSTTILPIAIAAFASILLITPVSAAPGRTVSDIIDEIITHDFHDHDVQAMTQDRTLEKSGHCPLEIKLQFPDNRLSRPEAPLPTLIIIDAKPLPLDNSKMDMFFSATHYKLETQQSFVNIEHAEPAHYSLHIQAPGCAIYSPPNPVTVTQRQQILVKLKPGFQLKYSLDSNESQ